MAGMDERQRRYGYVTRTADDPLSHAWWVEVTSNILASKRESIDRWYEDQASTIRSGLWHEDWGRDRWNKIQSSYHDGCLNAYQKHRPNGPLDGEVLPRAVEEARAALGRKE